MVLVDEIQGRFTAPDIYLVADALPPRVAPYIYTRSFLISRLLDSHFPLWENA